MLDVMAHFIYKYKNHPCISSEFVKFMASNSGNGAYKEARGTSQGLRLIEGGEGQALKVTTAKADTAPTKQSWLQGTTVHYKRVKTLKK
jgi:hypothetical protein